MWTIKSLTFSFRHYIHGFNTNCGTNHLPLINMRNFAEETWRKGTQGSCSCCINKSIKWLWYVYMKLCFYAPVWPVDASTNNFNVSVLSWWCVYYFLFYSSFCQWVLPLIVWYINWPNDCSIDSWDSVSMRPPVMLMHLPLLSMCLSCPDNASVNFYRLLPYSNAYVRW